MEKGSWELGKDKESCEEDKWRSETKKELEIDRDSEPNLVGRVATEGREKVNFSKLGNEVCKITRLKQFINLSLFSKKMEKEEALSVSQESIRND